MGRFDDLTGRRFGKLIALERVGKSDGNGVLWKCSCDCGGETTARANKLKSGRKKSCNCLWIKHKDLSDSEKLVGVWKQMIQRSRNPRNKDYRYYGAKGCYVCKGWATLKGFVKWALASGYKQGLTVDRIDGNKGYSPDNCHFIPHDENCAKQPNHRRKINEVALKTSQVERSA